MSEASKRNCLTCPSGKWEPCGPQEVALICLAADYCPEVTRIRRGRAPRRVDAPEWCPVEAKK